MSEQKLVIGIAGAGVAGLIAGIHLQMAGHRAKIFESGPMPGGRIKSIIVQGFLIEAGPEFIHGNGIETIGLLNKYQIPFVPSNGKMYQFRNGRFEPSGEVNGEWGELLDKMNDLDNDLPFSEFLNTYFPGALYNDLRNSAIGFAEGFDLADVKMASTKALVLEWMQEEAGQFRIPSGYHSLVRAMTDEFISLGGEFLFEYALESVNWNPGQIRITVRGKHEFSMDKLVISVPISMLSSSVPGTETVKFFPPLIEKQKAFARIGFGTVIKIVMVWESAFWKSRIPEAQFIFSESFISPWWTQFPLDIPLLTGWLGGPAADAVSGESDEFFLAKALESLSDIFSIAQKDLKNKLKDFRVFNWKKEPWTRGAYSYPLADSAQDKAFAKQPVENRIYFSGEAFYEGPFQGTVEAALVSGLTAARQLLKDIK